MNIPSPPAKKTLTPRAGALVDTSPLFQPCKVGHVQLANRFVMPGMQRGLCDYGSPTLQLANYYERRAKGGVAMIISESIAIDHPSATAQPSACRITPDTVDAWCRCIEGVRDAGSEMLLQLWHEGGRRDNSDGKTLSPSGLACPGLQQGQAMTAADLREVRDAYVASALLAQKAGATGIEVHAAHGYLLDQFLWAGTNSRGDDYGGASISSRARYPSEIISAIRAACGERFLISVRFSQWKVNYYRARIVNTIQELGVMTDMFRCAGADILHPSTRRFWTPEWPGSNRGFAGWVRDASCMPTITVGSVGLGQDIVESLTNEAPVETTVQASLAELIGRFEAEEFDFVAVGRGLIADSDWVTKVRAGDFSAVKPFSRALLAGKWNY